MFTYNELTKVAQAVALRNAQQLFKQSNEWFYVLSTAKLIKRNLVKILEEVESSTKIKTLQNLLSTNSLETMEEFSEFDMPANTRITVEFIQGLAENDFTAEEGISKIQAELEHEIISYWAMESQQESSILDFIESADIEFSEDGGIESYDMDAPQSAEEPFIVSWGVNGTEHTKLISTPPAMLKIAIPLATVFYWIDKDQNNLTMDDVITHLIQLITTKKLSVADGEVCILRSELPNQTIDNLEKVCFIDILSDVADCLSHSPNLDDLLDEDLFQQLCHLDKDLADFLAYAHGLNVLDQVCDASTVESHHAALFLEMR